MDSPKKRHNLFFKWSKGQKPNYLISWRQNTICLPIQQYHNACSSTCMISTITIGMANKLHIWVCGLPWCVAFSPDTSGKDGRISRHKSLHANSLRNKSKQVGKTFIFLKVVFWNNPTNDDSSTESYAKEDGIQHFTTHIFKVNVNSHREISIDRTTQN